MKITIIYDNTSAQTGVRADWGFSCLVECHQRTILFDTGADGVILMENMRKLDIDPASIDDVFISHPHFDHIGGLSAFLNGNNRVRIFVPPSLRGIRNAKEIIYVDKPKRLHQNVFSTGELEHIEQSLIINTDKGLVLIVGCSHPKMRTIFATASQFGDIYAIVGGLHGFDDYELFKDLSVICPTHCTQHKTEIKSRYPGKYVEGGVGKIIMI
ncbi:MBL fold metallo-hydrolase [candidate division KSB1 bacterium]|nr:MBL fold metallo-hydrolase [candidate division KSB1 bacterium]